MIFKTIWGGGGGGGGGGDHARMFQELRILIILKLFAVKIVNSRIGKERKAL